MTQFDRVLLYKLNYTIDIFISEKNYIAYNFNNEISRTLNFKKKFFRLHLSNKKNHLFIVPLEILIKEYSNAIISRIFFFFQFHPSNREFFRRWPNVGSALSYGEIELQLSSSGLNLKDYYLFFLSLSLSHALPTYYSVFTRPSLREDKRREARPSHRDVMGLNCR